MAAVPAVNILLVDDHPENLVALEAILGEPGQNLVRATSGPEALKRLLEKEFALILLDVQMPGMDGFQTARLIRERERSRLTPILFLTAHETGETPVVRGYAAGAVDYLFKPVVPEILKAKVATFVELARKTQELRAAVAQRERAERAVRELNRHLERRVAERTAELAAESQERRRAEEGVRTIMEHARCLLWHAYVEAPAEPRKPYRWDLRLFDEEAAQRFLPLTLRPGESYAEAFYRCKPAEDRVFVDWNARAAFEGNRTSYSQEYRCRRADGELRWMAEETHLEPLAPGRWRAVGVCTDITERKRLEEELRQRVADLAASARQKDAFLAMLAHELRNPLGALSNALQVMKRAGPETPAYTRAQESAIRQVEHQTRLVEDLLDVSRITRGRLELRQERLELARLVRETVEDYRGRLEQAGLSLALDLPDGAVPVMGDRVRLAQVLSNLLDNAAKFTPPGGHVIVECGVRNAECGVPATADASVSDTPRSALRTPHSAFVTVRDTGLGIEPRLLPDLFDTFTQADQSLDRSRGGLGLGLALVKGLVGLHGGSVQVHSEGPGRGAAFTLLLPLAAEPKALQETPRLAPRLPGRLRILIVEDNRDAAETLRDLLELFGYDVELAHTGPEGVEVARRFHPEVVLCDLGLPGMDGYQVASALRRDPATAAAHLIAVTGYGGEDDRRRCEEVGFEQHLTKPVDPEALQQLLASVAPS